jgi:hypothetical protein
LIEKPQTRDRDEVLAPIRSWGVAANRGSQQSVFGGDPY